MNAETGGGLTAEERERLLIASHTVERQHEIGEALFALVERILADRDAALERVEALGQDGSLGSLMEDIRAELEQYASPGFSNLATSRVMHQIREHLRAALDPAPSGAP